MPRVGFEPTIPAFKRAKTFHAFFFLLFGLWGYWHCGHSWPIVPASIVKMIVEKQMECRLAGETEYLGKNLPQRHICPTQNPTWTDPVLNPGAAVGSRRLTAWAMARPKFTVTYCSGGISLYTTKYKSISFCVKLPVLALINTSSYRIPDDGQSPETQY
jgi:hypothetical protein